MSQCDAIFAVLSDCKNHDMREIHQRVGFCRLNSRISELRKRGHTITCDRSGGHYTYRLIASEGEPQAQPIDQVDATPRVSPAVPASPSDTRQPTLWEAAA